MRRLLNRSIDQSIGRLIYLVEKISPKGQIFTKSGHTASMALFPEKKLLEKNDKNCAFVAFCF
jgi:hypothetical protein